jgi:CelD/BcsL family acetyltransferase involved in cellulose biosynthesis
VCAAALQAVLARSSPKDSETCAALLASNDASALLQRRLAHALPTLPACVVRSASDAPESAPAWTRFAMQHTTVLSRGLETSALHQQLTFESTLIETER